MIERILAPCGAGRRVLRDLLRSPGRLRLPAARVGAPCSAGRIRGAHAAGISADACLYADLGVDPSDQRLRRSKRRTSCCAGAIDPSAALSALAGRPGRRHRRCATRSLGAPRAWRFWWACCSRPIRPPRSDRLRSLDAAHHTAQDRARRALEMTTAPVTRRSRRSTCRRSLSATPTSRWRGGWACSSRRPP